MAYGVQQTDEGLRSIGTIYLCMNKGCGEFIGKTPKKYCEQCSTAEGRRKLNEDNLKVQAEYKEKEAKGLLPWQNGKH